MAEFESVWSNVKVGVKSAELVKLAESLQMIHSLLQACQHCISRFVPAQTDITILPHIGEGILKRGWQVAFSPILREDVTVGVLREWCRRVDLLPGLAGIVACSKKLVEMDVMRDELLMCENSDSFMRALLKQLDGHQPDLVHLYVYLSTLELPHLYVYLSTLELNRRSLMIYIYIYIYIYAYI